ILRQRLLVLRLHPAMLAWLHQFPRFEIERVRVRQNLAVDVELRREILLCQRDPVAYLARVVARQPDIYAAQSCRIGQDGEIAANARLPRKLAPGPHEVERDRALMGRFRLPVHLMPEVPERIDAGTRIVSDQRDGLTQIRRFDKRLWREWHSEFPNQISRRLKPRLEKHKVRLRGLEVPLSGSVGEGLGV